MTTKLESGTVQSHERVQPVKIPSFWERLAIKISAFFNGVDTKQFDQTSEAYSKAHASLYDERVISPRPYSHYQKYQELCKEIDETPTARLIQLKRDISVVRSEIESLNSRHNATYDHEDIAYSYIGSGGSGYDGSLDRDRIDSDIRKAESKLQNLNSNLHHERGLIAQSRAIPFYENEQHIPHYMDVRTHVVYESAASGIKAAYQSHPDLTRTEVAVLSMPLFLSDTEQRNLERFLS